MTNELEKKYEELVEEYKRLINLSESKQFFDIPFVNLLVSEIAALKQQGEVTDEMIEKWILKHHSFRTYTWKCACIIGAKAMRDNKIK